VHRGASLPAAPAEAIPARAAQSLRLQHFFDTPVTPARGFSE
jgi:hypothetical protein